MDSNKKQGILKWTLILSIVIVINLFFNVALSLVFNSPEYDEYCQTEQVNKVAEDQQECLAKGGQWNEYENPKPVPLSVEQDTQREITGYCNEQYECQKNYQTARENYEKNVFISLITLGVITLILGLVLNSNVVMGTALSLAAVLNFVIASVRYWSSAHEITKLIILAIALVALIYIAYKKFSDKIS